ncbi:MAG: lactate 2-monooxygenase [Bacteroidota bacterium]
MQKESPAVSRQREIYVNGVSGQRPSIPIRFSDLQAAAAEKLPAEAYAYIAGGAGAERTMYHNVHSFDRWRIWPRMLRDVSQRDLSIELLGRRLPSPFLLSPIGVLELAHADADLAVARASSRHQIPMIFSNQASFAMEECAAVMGDAPRWFQLYWSKSNDLVASLVQRAEACGCEAIVVTLDTTLLGWRERDLDMAYLPFMQGKGIAQYISDPVFQKLLDAPEEESSPAIKPPISLETLSNLTRLMSKYPGSTLGNFRSKRPLRAVRTFTNMYSRPSLSWSDLPFLRSCTSLPILLKGILHPEDARMAVDAGVDGIIVSNHGGRQVDGAIAAIEALPMVAEAVKGQIPVLMDSGIRNGAHAFKALALGASAVCIGRPYALGLALAGEKGVEEVLKNLLADLELTMGLAGCTQIGQIDRKILMDGK